MNAKISQALTAFVRNFQVVTVEIDGTKGVAVADRTGDPVNVTFLSAEGSRLIGGRFFVPVAGYKTGVLADLARDAVARGDLVRGFSASHALEFFGLRGAVPTFATEFARRFAIAHAPNTEMKPWSDLAEAMLRAGGLPELEEVINKDAVDALGSISSFGANVYEFYAQPADRGVVRRQAAGAYPLLAQEIALRFRVKMAVDRKESPADALMTGFGVDKDGNPLLSKSILKKLAGKRYSDGRVPLPTIVDALSKVPADWFPKEEAEWNAFVDLTDTFFRVLGPDFGGKLDGLLAGCGGKWVDFVQRIAKASAETLPPAEMLAEDAASWVPELDTTRAGLTAAASNAKDVLLAFRNLILLPVSAHAGGGVPVYLGPDQVQCASDAAANMLFGGKAIPAIMELTRHWHTQAHNILDATGEDVARGAQRSVAEDGWAPISDAWVAPNGITLFPLTDPREIKDEGAGGLGEPGPDRNGIMGLGHCVGGYSQRCRTGDSHIVSLREMDGSGSFKRLSTVEFGRIDADTTALEVRQHHGPKNKQAPAAAKEALAWYLSEVADKRIPINVDGVLSYLAGRRRSVEEVEAYSGYDWREAETIEKALAPWAPYLPKRLRGAQRRDFETLPELEALREALVPTYSNAIVRQR